MLLYLLAGQPPTDFWHDPFVQFIINVVVALIVGIGTVLVAIWVFRQQRTHKKIAYQVISNAPIVNVNKGLENRVSVRLDDHPVKAARQVVLKVSNSGNVAVKRDDYDEPLKFVFTGSKVIGSNILSTEPENLIDSIDNRTFVNIGVDSAQLHEFLLNPKQSITLTVLLDGAYNQLDVRGRIVDGSIVEYVERELSVNTLGLLCLFFTLYSFIVFLLLKYTENSIPSYLVVIAAVFFNILLFGLPFWVKRRS